uniref:Peptidase S54 rhomboid domain-containing protein n=1 Tax=Physcomitrium patens TaxID=3218 RepID=A0A7I4CYJ4_PHYPA
MNAGVSGFKNAIVTKGIVVTCGLVSLVLAARGDAKAYNLSYQRLELWRLVVSPLVFTSLPELLFGLYLLYFFRVFERQAGSIKYLFFVFFTTSVSTFLELVFLFTLKDSSFISSIRLNSGPTGLIFSSFVLFFFDVPVSIRFKLLGIKVSEKSFVYLIGLQVSSLPFASVSIVGLKSRSIKAKCFYCGQGCTP